MSNKVAFLFGENSKKAISKIQGQLDNIELVTFNTIQDLIAHAKLRNEKYSRIVFYQKLVSEGIDETFKELVSYLDEKSQETELVFVVDSNNTLGNDVLFDTYFSAPLYTCVLLDSKKGTPVVLIKSLVRDSIQELSKTYYGKEIDSGSKISKAKDGTSTLLSSSTEVGESTPESVVKEVMQNMGNDTKNSSMYEKSQSEFISEIDEKVDENKESQYSSEGVVENDLEEDLSLGTFGEEHTDTGFLDDDEFDELDNLPDIKEDAYVKPTEYTQPKKIVSSIGKISLYTGPRGRGITDTICNLAEELGNSLIIDLDLYGNGVLTYTNIIDFYSKGNDLGINKLRIYSDTDSKVDIISNGFGNDVSTSVLERLLTDTDVLGNYENIFIDCPIDCLFLFEGLENIQNNLVTTLLLNGNIGDIITISLYLSNIKECPRFINKLVSEGNIKVANRNDYTEEDIQFAKSTLSLYDYSWLDKL